MQQAAGMFLVLSHVSILSDLLKEILILILDGPIHLEPSSTVLHYAQTLFEGMKAYRDENGKVTLFRPDMNMKRMNNSARRIALPVRHYVYSIAMRVVDSRRCCPSESRPSMAMLY
jgi:hypothetical protein